MRYFQITEEPTEEQLLDVVGGEAFDASVIGGEGYIVVIDGEPPEWIPEEAEVLNFPGELHRCWSCGELI